jgi:DNA-binding MarR family transcriptional regulator
MMDSDENVIVNNYPCGEPAMTDILRPRPGYALRRAANAMMAELSRRLAAIDLRIAEASVLLLIDGREDATASEIGRTLDIQRANMVPLLGRLEVAGLIERRPIDGKSQAVLLTALGRERRAEADAITATFEDDLLARIAPEHRDHLVPALSALWGGEG